MNADCSFIFFHGNCHSLKSFFEVKCVFGSSNSQRVSTCTGAACLIKMKAKTTTTGATTTLIMIINSSQKLDYCKTRGM